MPTKQILPLGSSVPRRERNKTQQHKRGKECSQRKEKEREDQRKFMGLDIRGCKTSNRREGVGK